MHSEWLLHQTAQYNAISAQFETKYIYETYKTETPFGSNIVSIPRSCLLRPYSLKITADRAEILRCNTRGSKCRRNFYQQRPRGDGQVSLGYG